MQIFQHFQNEKKCKKMFHRFLPVLLSEYLLSIYRICTVTTCELVQLNCKVIKYMNPKEIRDGHWFQVHGYDNF